MLSNSPNDLLSGIFNLKSAWFYFDKWLICVYMMGFGRFAWFVFVREAGKGVDELHVKHIHQYMSMVDWRVFFCKKWGVGCVMASKFPCKERLPMIS